MSFLCGVLHFVSSHCTCWNIYKTGQCGCASNYLSLTMYILLCVSQYCMTISETQSSCLMFHQYQQVKCIPLIIQFDHCHLQYNTRTNDRYISLFHRGYTFRLLLLTGRIQYHLLPSYYQRPPLPVILP